MASVGRNEQCPCGSGRKSKRCCQGQDLAGVFIEGKGRGGKPDARLARFIQPLVSAAAGDPEALEYAHELGALFWNLALCDDALRDVVLEELALEVLEAEEERAELWGLAARMFECHKKMFPELHGGAAADGRER